mmetsp:Transcript_1121/g.3224  ORF Transcript_1121/g.3224 Transcript_1121/m.3224 type:complete len:216 (+) Transcript_1121:757-1404(+)
MTCRDSYIGRAVPTLRIHKKKKKPRCPGPRTPRGLSIIKDDALIIRSKQDATTTLRPPWKKPRRHQQRRRTRRHCATHHRAVRFCCGGRRRSGRRRGGRRGRGRRVARECRRYRRGRRRGGGGRRLPTGSCSARAGRPWRRVCRGCLGGAFFCCRGCGGLRGLCRGSIERLAREPRPRPRARRGAAPTRHLRRRRGRRGRASPLSTTLVVRRRSG